MIDLGTVRPGSTIRIPFNSFDKDDGSSITLTNYSTADILVYKDGGTTERASASGYTATTDFDAKTGKHLAIIDLADNTTAGFFSAGSEYLVAIDSVTIDTVTTGGWIARFRIGYTGAILDTTIATLSTQTSFTLTAGPAEDNALVGMWAVIHDVASAVQQSWVLISGYTGATKTVTLVAGATFTAAATDNISVMFPAPLQPTTLGNKLDVSSGGEAGVDWGNVGSPSTSVGLSGTTIKAVTDAVTAGTVSDKTGYALSAGGVDAIWDEPLAAHTTADTPGLVVNMLTQDTVTLSTDVALGSIVGQMLDNGTAWSYDRTTDSLEAQRDNTGTAGAGLTDLGGMSTTMKAQVEAEVDDALVAQRLDELLNADSDIDGAAPPTVGSVFHELMSKTAGSFTYDQTTDSNEAIKDALPAAAPTAAAIADAVWDEDATAHQTGGTFGQAIGDPGADITTIYQSVVTDAAGTNVAADIIAVKAETASIQSDTNDLQTRVPAALTGAGNMKADALAVDGSTTAATNLKQSATVIYVGSVTGAATTTTLIDAGLTQADVDHWKGRIVIFLTGSLKYQATDITAFDPVTDKLTFTALTNAPAGGDTYVIL